jgi:hypothetical protein
VNAACELLKPFSDREMRKYPVSTRVNRVVNDDEACAALWHPIKRMTELLANLLVALWPLIFYVLRVSRRCTPSCEWRVE